MTTTTKLPVKCTECGVMLRDFAPEGAPVCQCGEKVIRAMKDEMMGRATTNESPAPQAEKWSCGVCGDDDVPHKFRIFGLCYKCAARKSIDKRNRKIELLQSRQAPAPQPPVEGLREALEEKLREFDVRWARDGGPFDSGWVLEVLATLASPSLTAEENTKSDGEFEPGPGCQMVRTCVDGKYCYGHCKTGPSDAPLEDALGHLGSVLSILAELHPDDRSRALDNALAFYNARRPGAQVEPVAGVTRLVHQWPGPSDPSPPAPDVREALEWVRGEIFALCEATEDSARDGQDFSRGRCLEAKRMRRAMGEVIRERLAALSQQPVAVADREAIIRECASIAADHTPKKFEGTLAAHATGRAIECAILALLSAQPAKGER